MRRFRLLITLLLAATPVAAHGQLTLKGGLSFASATSSDFLPDLETRTGAAGGISLGLGPARGLQLRPEALFVQKGGKLASDQSFTLNELNIPVLVQVTLPVPGISPFIYAGPQAEYELSCTVADTDCVDTGSLRWGAVGGAGVRLGSLLSLEGRYNWTLSELADDIESKPRSLLLFVGLSLGGR